MKNQDYKDLEAKEVQLRVQIDRAKSLISSWVDGSDDEDDQQLPTVLSKGAGLGSAAKPSVQPSAALAKLKRKKDPKKYKTVTVQQSSDSEEESRSKRTKRGATKSAFDSYKKRK